MMQTANAVGKKRRTIRKVIGCIACENMLTPRRKTNRSCEVSTATNRFAGMVTAMLKIRTIKIRLQEISSAGVSLAA